MPFYGKAFYRGFERQSKNPRTIYTLVGCGFFTIACGFIPYIVVQHMRPLNSREEVRCALKIFSFHCWTFLCVITPLSCFFPAKALNAAAIRRGAFSNSGTKDAGLDKDWDFKSNKYRYSMEKNVKPLARSRFDDILSPLGEQSAEISKAQCRQKER